MLYYFRQTEYPALIPSQGLNECALKRPARLNQAQLMLLRRRLGQHWRLLTLQRRGRLLDPARLEGCQEQIEELLAPLQHQDFNAQPSPELQLATTWRSIRAVHQPILVRQLHQRMLSISKQLLIY